MNPRSFMKMRRSAAGFKPFLFAAAAIGCLVIGTGGCVEQTILVQSNPPGALVYLNDQEVGRTPIRKDFLWHGKYDVVVRKEGFKSFKTTAGIWPPVYQWPPLDLVAQLLPIPFKDHHTLTYTLEPDTPLAQDDPSLVDRAQALRGQLESSQRPRPATRSTP